MLDAWFGDPLLGQFRSVWSDWIDHERSDRKITSVRLWRSLIVGDRRSMALPKY